MGISADAIFFEDKINRYNAFSRMFRFRFLNLKGANPNFIVIGSSYFTLEILLHEINEIETNTLIWRFCMIGNKYIMVDGFTSLVSHFISPFGENSFIDPRHYKDVTPDGMRLLE